MHSQDTRAGLAALVPLLLRLLDREATLGAEQVRGGLAKAVIVPNVRINALRLRLPVLILQEQDVLAAGWRWRRLVVNLTNLALVAADVVFVRESVGGHLAVLAPLRSDSAHYVSW